MESTGAFFGLLCHPMGQTLRRTGPYSRSAQLAKPKRRTRESRFLLQIRMDLTKHLGGLPNIAQTLMIDRIAMTLLRIELMDRDALESDTPGVLTERQSRDYLAWVNTAGRLPRSLGLEATKEHTPSLHELINAPVSEAAPAPPRKQPWSASPLSTSSRCRWYKTPRNRPSREPARAPWCAAGRTVCWAIVAP